MAGLAHVGVEARRREERKIWRTAFGVSLLFHLLVLLLWRYDVPLPSPFAAAGPRMGDARAAGGSTEVLRLRTSPPRPITPPPLPIPAVSVPDPVEVEPETEVDPAAALGEAPGELEAPGLPGGEGRGDGGTAMEGLFRLVPPSPRGMIIPPTNRRFRGREIRVWVFVDEFGRVVPDSTRLQPPTPDEEFNRLLRAEAAQWVFEPARRGGRPVAAWFPYVISM